MNFEQEFCLSNRPLTSVLKTKLGAREVFIKTFKDKQLYQLSIETYIKFSQAGIIPKLLFYNNEDCHVVLDSYGEELKKLFSEFQLIALCNLIFRMQKASQALNLNKLVYDKNVLMFVHEVVTRKIHEKNDVNLNSVLKRLATELERHEKTLPKCFCHGDLAPRNVLVRKKTVNDYVYRFIDIEGSSYKSVLYDIACLILYSKNKTKDFIHKLIKIYIMGMGIIIKDEEHFVNLCVLAAIARGFACIAELASYKRAKQQPFFNLQEELVKMLEGNLDEMMADKARQPFDINSCSVDERAVLKEIVLLVLQFQKQELLKELSGCGGMVYAQR